MLPITDVSSASTRILSGRKSGSSSRQSYNILGDDCYLPPPAAALIQTDADGSYDFKLLDASLQVMDDWEHVSLRFLHGKLSGSLCVSGDLFFLFPLTMHLGIRKLYQTYSLSQKTLLADDTVDFWLFRRYHHQ